MIASDINSELPLSQDEHTQVSVSDKRDSKQSSNTSSTTPNSEPTTSAVPDELLLMMTNLKANMAKRLQELKEEEIMFIAKFMMKISTTAYSNEASLKKILPNLNIVAQNVSKLDYQLNKE
eukprot:1912602-Ditylum_brightwellii.AAC.1